MLLAFGVLGFSKIEIKRNRWEILRQMYSAYAGARRGCAEQRQVRQTDGGWLSGLLFWAGDQAGMDLKAGFFEKGGLVKFSMLGSSYFLLLLGCLATVSVAVLWGQGWWAAHYPAQEGHIVVKSWNCTRGRVVSISEKGTGDKRGYFCIPGQGGAWWGHVLAVSLSGICFGLVTFLQAQTQVPCYLRSLNQST